MVIVMVVFLAGTRIITCLDGKLRLFLYMCQGLKSHCFPMVGMVINPIVGVYIPIIRIPSLKVG